MELLRAREKERERERVRKGDSRKTLLAYRRVIHVVCMCHKQQCMSRHLWTNCFKQQRLTSHHLNAIHTLHVTNAHRTYFACRGATTTIHVLKHCSRLCWHGFSSAARQRKYRALPYKHSFFKPYTVYNFGSVWRACLPPCLSACLSVCPSAICLCVSLSVVVCVCICQQIGVEHAQTTTVCNSVNAFRHNHKTLRELY